MQQQQRHVEPSVEEAKVVVVWALPGRHGNHHPHPSKSKISLPGSLHEDGCMGKCCSLAEACHSIEGAVNVCDLGEVCKGLLVAVVFHLSLLGVQCPSWCSCSCPHVEVVENTEIGTPLLVGLSRAVPSFAHQLCQAHAFKLFRILVGTNRMGAIWHHKVCLLPPTCGLEQSHGHFSVRLLSVKEQDPWTTRNCQDTSEVLWGTWPQAGNNRTGRPQQPVKVRRLQAVGTILPLSQDESVLFPLGPTMTNEIAERQLLSLVLRYTEPNLGRLNRHVMTKQHFKAQRLVTSDTFTFLSLKCSHIMLISTPGVKDNLASASTRYRGKTKKAEKIDSDQDNRYFGHGNHHHHHHTAVTRTLSKPAGPCDSAGKLWQRLARRRGSWGRAASSHVRAPQLGAWRLGFRV